MTSEVLIMNKNAIVMAADSAVTVGNMKTYNGVNKLFMLSNEPPMGIMIFGSADFESIPMETLIKEYREKADFFKKDNIQLIKEDFLNYLSENTPESNLSKKIEYSLNSFKEIITSQTSNLDEEGFLEYVDSHVTNDLPDFVKGISEFNKYDDEFKQLIPNYIKNNHECIVDNLKNIFFNTLINGGTGIVIAGFNKQDMFPSYIKFNLCWNKNKNIQIFGCKSEINFKGSAIIPFAQNDVINTFLTGIDDYIKLSFYNYLHSFTHGFTDELKNYFIQSNKIKGKSLNEVKKILSKCETTNDKRVDMFIHDFEKLTENFVDEILASVEALPKEELANMSESLIHITSLKRKISFDLESVGGDIDVAIISKGDGFIWKKRKHYFDADLNPQFFDKKYPCQKV